MGYDCLYDYLVVRQEQPCLPTTKSEQSFVTLNLKPPDRMKLLHCSESENETHTGKCMSTTQLSVPGTEIGRCVVQRAKTLPSNYPKIGTRTWSADTANFQSVTTIYIGLNFLSLHHIY